MKKGVEVIRDYDDLIVVLHNKPLQQIGTHAHKEHQVLIPLRGAIDVLADQSSYTLQNNQMIYLPKELMHAFNSSQQQGERIVVYITDRKWKQMGGEKHNLSIMPAPNLIKEISFYILFGQQKKYLNCYIDSLIFSLFESLSGARVNELSTTKNQNIKTAIQQIREQSSAKIDFEKVAKRSGLSRRNLTRLFKQETGLTPKQFQTKLRIEHAMKIFEARKDASVTEVSFEVGYESLGSFLKAFKALTGKIPSGWS